MHTSPPEARRPARPPPPRAPAPQARPPPRDAIPIEITDFGNTLQLPLDLSLADCIDLLMHAFNVQSREPIILNLKFTIQLNGLLRYLHRAQIESRFREAMPQRTAYEQGLQIVPHQPPPRVELIRVNRPEYDDFYLPLNMEISLRENIQIVSYAVGENVLNIRSEQAALQITLDKEILRTDLSNDAVSRRFNDDADRRRKAMRLTSSQPSGPSVVNLGLGAYVQGRPAAAGGLPRGTIAFRLSEQGGDESHERIFVDARLTIQEIIDMLNLAFLFYDLDVSDMFEFRINPNNMNRRDDLEVVEIEFSRQMQTRRDETATADPSTRLNFSRQQLGRTQFFIASRRDRADEFDPFLQPELTWTIRQNLTIISLAFAQDVLPHLTPFRIAGIPSLNFRLPISGIRDRINRRTERIRLARLAEFDRVEQHRNDPANNQLNQAFIEA